MKRFFFLLIGICLTAGVCVQAEEPVVINAPEMTVDKTSYSFTENGITVSVSYGSAYPANHAWNSLGITYFACLANSSITFSADKDMKGLAINGWVRKNFTASCDHGTIDYISDEYDDATGEPVLTISDIDASSVTIQCYNQLRCFSVEVYFTENPGGIQGEVLDTIRFTAVTAEAQDYSDDPDYSSEGHYSYWLMLAPQEGYPQVWLSLYSAVKGDLSGEYSLYDFNVDEYTYVQLSANELDYEYAYDQEFTIAKTNDGYHIEGWIIADNDVQYEFVYDGPITLTGVAEGMDQTEENTSAIKTIREGRLVIIRNGKTYNALGY